MTNEKRLENGYMIHFNASYFVYGVMCEVRRP